MKVFPIKSPLDGEQVIGVHPALNHVNDQDWRRRVNNFTGRSLTHTALREEQAGRSGRIALLGQLLSPGVISGLIVDQSAQNTGAGEQAEFLNITTGYGIDINGEMVTLNSPLQVDIREIPVFAPASVLDSSETESDADPSNVLLARKLGPTLGAVIASGLSLPRVAVLVLQPVQIEMNLQQSDDPCELDPEQYAYENWQLVDGARLVLYSWPEEMISLPGQPSEADWRNKIANSIFMHEKNLPVGENLPWDNLGVALGVIGFDENWKVSFVDRHAAVRAGGKRRRAASILTDIGNRFLWQARFQQFNEQLAETLTALEGETNVATRAAAAFRYLPPVGVLPKDFIDLKTYHQNFFPLAYQVEAIAIPYEQLDVVVQDSAALATYDFNRADRVQVLVPVPQVNYEPELLQTESIDPEFDFTIEKFVDERNDWLGRRLEIRRKAASISLAVRGDALEFATSDPGAVDIAELAAPFETALINFGENWRYLKGLDMPPVNWQNADFDDVDDVWLSGNSGLGFNSAYVETELNDMQDRYVSLFCRKTFNLSTLDAAKNYRLEIITNGGFYAYLNGNEISSDNLTDKTFDTVAEKQIDAVVRVYDIGNLSSSLIAGDNLLAFQVHAAQLSSKQFIFLPRLVEKQYVEDLEADDFATVIMTDESGNPKLVDAEPVYSVSALEDLKTFFNGRTYQAEDKSIKRIWSVDDIEKFDNIATEGIEGFIDFLSDKVNKANDKVDFGFVRLQTDIYRIRQFILGNEDATKLAISPILAGIAKGQTAVATTEQITKFAKILSSQTQTTKPPTNENEPNVSAGFAVNILAPQAKSGGDFILSDSIEAEPSVFLKDGFLVNEFLTADNLFVATKEKALTDEKFTLNASSASISGLFGSSTFTTKSIEEQSSVIGSFPNFRNVTVGERLGKAVTEDAVDAGRANRVENIRNIKNTGLSMDGISVPGFEANLRFDDISEGLLDGIISGADSGGVKDNEASRFNDSVLNLEHSTALLRLVERRIKTYRVMIDRCNKTLSELFSIRQRMDRRLKEIEDELAEARHDVSVSRALKSEEQARIDAINNRREAVLEEHVPFLLFRRPRLSDVLINTPVHDLHPDLSQAPLPVCDVDDDETPEEIAAMMEVVRDAPLKWFKLSSKVIERINRLPDLRVLLRGARLRANTKKTPHRLLAKRYDGLNKLSFGINKTLLASLNTVKVQRQQTALIDVVKFDQLGWQESRKHAVEVISFGDVIDGNHGRMGASKLAAQELDQISNVSVCLYIHFAEVLPTIRLDWAERLSQFDAPFNLRNLYSLPRWGEIDYIERNEMQRLVDWLYGRINAVHSDASDMINELIRICILLASHAPVNKLISGLVPEPVTVKPGSMIDIVADLTRVRIGMNVAMVAGRQNVAHGRVVDIIGGRVQAQILSTLSASTFIEKNTKVQIGEPRATGGAVYQQNRNLFKLK